MKMSSSIFWNHRSFLDVFSIFQSPGALGVYRMTLTGTRTGSVIKFWGVSKFPYCKLHETSISWRIMKGAFDHPSHETSIQLQYIPRWIFRIFAMSSESFAIFCVWVTRWWFSPQMTVVISGSKFYPAALGAIQAATCCHSHVDLEPSPRDRWPWMRRCPCGRVASRVVSWLVAAYVWGVRKINCHFTIESLGCCAYGNLNDWMDMPDRYFSKSWFCLEWRSIVTFNSLKLYSQN